MIKIECDRCEAQMPVKVTPMPGLGGFSAKPILPENWRAVGYPEKDGQRNDRHLCGTCVNALREFFGEPETSEPEVMTLAEAAEAQQIGQAVGMAPMIPVQDPGAVGEDPRPNLTERARVIAVGEQRADCPECGEPYKRGELVEHMQREHQGGGGKRKCPECLLFIPNPEYADHVKDGCPATQTVTVSVCKQNPMCLCGCDDGQPGTRNPYTGVLDCSCALENGDHATTCLAYVEPS